MARLHSGTRVTIFLPANDVDESAAASRAVTHVHARYGGCTVSSLEPPVFTGYWFDASNDWLYIDQVIQLILDLEQESGDPALSGSLSHLKEMVRDEYSAAGSEQLEIWVVMQSIARIAE
ncbi:MAG: hypothetical protein ACR2JC_04935 [Chloroflexota bacterium]